MYTFLIVTPILHSYSQARFLYNVPFSEDERQDVKYMIQSNLYCYIAILLEARERFEEESSNDMRMKSSNQHCPLGIWT